MKKQNKGCYVNRELSWLKFNERVLEEAGDKSTPLCERLSFVSIFQSNLDEFYMVRVGALHDQLSIKDEIRENKTNMTSQEQITAILDETKRLGEKRDKIYFEIMEELTEKGFGLVLFHDLGEDDLSAMEKYFYNEIMPLLSPMIVGRKQPFPFLKNCEIYAVVVLKTIRGKEKIGIIPCSSACERLIPIPSKKGYYILQEELILHYVSKIFRQYHIRGKSLVRITRNGDIDPEAMEDEDLNYRDMMAEIIKMRKKLFPVRLEMTRKLDTRVVQALCSNLGIMKEQVFSLEIPLDLEFVGQVRDLLRDRAALFFPKHTPSWSCVLNKNESILSQVEQRDVLLSYPYENIRPFLYLLHEAAVSKDVVSIKMTLYRLAKNSKVAEALIEAAENGKEVVAVVELQARFDEESNIEWSRRLENAGCLVIYGLDHLKVHSKLCLITRKTPKGIAYITQIGTGNYNEKTAALYTDLSFMTADMEIGMDGAEVFNALSMGEIVRETRHLLAAPNELQNKILYMIEEQIMLAQKNKAAYIGIKINSLTDIKIMKKLIEASMAGVKIDMIVRGICCLLPGIKGFTDNIRIISIVGRFLEHSRIYIFGARGQEKIYIASADFMTRNTRKRIEIASPIYDPGLKNRIFDMFELMLSDNVKAWELKSNGFYEKAFNQKIRQNAQECLLRQAMGLMEIKDETERAK